MLNKLFILMIALVLVVPLISAEYLPHEKNTNFELVVSSNNATTCNWTYIQYPNGSKINYNLNMTRVVTDFNYTIDAGNFSSLGSTCMGITCYDGINYETGSVCREVGYTGSSLNTESSIIYLGLLGILVFILFVNFWGMGYLPNSNERDEEGRILSVTYLKYLRLPLWLFAYFLFTAVIFLSSNIAYGFLPDELFAKLLFSLFSILMALSPVIVVVLMISFFVKFFHDKEVQKMLNRGMFPGGQL